MSSPQLKITGIILAAGLSKRMGTIKALLPFGNSLLLDRVIENAHQSELARVLVVLGHEAERIRETINFKESQLVFNPNFAMGQSTSLRAGLAAVSDDSDGAMFLLGDQPFVDSRIIDALIRACKERSWRIVIPTCYGKRGNPVLVHRAIFHVLHEITGDTGARVLFRSMEDQILEVEVSDPGIHLDVDTIEDYRKLNRTSRIIQGGT